MADETVQQNEDTASADLPATVKVTGPGVSIERGVDEGTMNAVIGLLFGPPVPSSGGGYQSGSGGGGSSGSGGGGSEWDARMTLGEFLDECGAKTFPHKICATGFYLTAIKGAKDFNREEVKSALLAAREDMPGNYARDWSTATNMSLIAPEGHDPNRFYIPRTGKKAIESAFQEAPKPRRGRRTTKRASSNGETE